jgi:hypothetical protein
MQAVDACMVDATSEGCRGLSRRQCSFGVCRAVYLQAQLKNDQSVQTVQCSVQTPVSTDQVGHADCQEDAKSHVARAMHACVEGRLGVGWLNMVAAMPVSQCARRCCCRNVASGVHACTHMCSHSRKYSCKESCQPSQRIQSTMMALEFVTQCLATSAVDL